MARPRPDSGSWASTRASARRLPRDRRLRMADEADGGGKGHWAGGRRRRSRTLRNGSPLIGSMPGSKPRPLSTTSSMQ